jgi:ribosomal protein S18 acetylase RimI-like enzyme
LIGLVAAYCNDQKTRMAYVTSVSVIREWTGKGIAEHLMQQCIDHATASHMRQIKLEVAQTNRLAIKLYEKCGFAAAQRDGQCISMVMNLKSANP